MAGNSPPGPGNWNLWLDQDNAYITCSDNGSGWEYFLYRWRVNGGPWQYPAVQVIDDNVGPIGEPGNLDAQVAYSNIGGDQLTAWSETKTVVVP